MLLPVHKRNWFKPSLLAITLLSAVYFSSDIILANPLPSKIYQIKAGFLLQFTSYVEWPDNDRPVINICIFGDDPFGKFIKEMIAEKPTNRTGKKRVLHRIPAGQSLSICQLVFSTENSTTDIFWRSLPDNHSILLVSEFDGFNNQGGMISYYEENRHVRIEINNHAARKAGLNISSELLKHAKLTPQPGTGEQ